jgi:cell wall-associated NlpC family hydrolase
VLASSALAHTHGHHVRKISTSKGGYVTRNGDFDWAIAHKYGISLAKLHSANPGINWNALQVGVHLRMPSGSESSNPQHFVAEHSSSHSVSRSYAIREGDNDWILAHRAGITVRQLKALNPSINWSQIHPGQHIHLPGSAGAVAEATSHSIRGRYAKITGQAVRIHRAEGINTSTITTVDSGTLVKVLDRDGAWYRLRFPKGTEGWVKSEFLASAQTPEHSSSHRSRHHHYHDTFVAHHGSRRHHGNSGEYLAANEVPSNEIIHKALTYQHVPYVWGASSRSGTDCSGFTTQVFRSKGIHLPRTSREQAHVGEKVTKSNLQAGDLVFFHTKRGSRVTHVGVYIGKGKFIHASSGGGQVQVNSLNGGYYANHFSTARRVASSHGSSK